MILALLGFVFGLAAAPADVKGKWDGTVPAATADGGADEDSVLLVLDQQDAIVTGSLGGNENDQHPIASGTIDGNKHVAREASRERTRVPPGADGRG